MTADAAARARVADELDRTLFVGAGAGTGKTTALVGRVVRLAVTGAASMNDVAAITFTEAAAAELRDRVREALERAASGREVAGAGPGATTLVPTVEEQHRAARALHDLDGATLSTLHGFAQRILAAHAVEAGLPPRFEVLGSEQALVDFRHRWRAFLDVLLDDRAIEPALVRAMRCGVTLAHLHQVARDLEANWDQVADHDLPPRPPLSPVDASAVAGSLDAALDLARHCVDDDDRLAAHLRSLVPFRHQLDADDEGALLDALVNAPTLTCAVGRKENWTIPKSEVTDHLEAARDACAMAVDTVAAEALSHLVAELCRFTLANAASRRRAGTLSFHDLLVLTRDLLRARPEVCAALGRRFTRILVDEFQDTDPIQAELAMRIAGRGDPTTPWSELEVEPGRLFFVGDPKQSIYRFRRASIELYLRMQALLADDPVSLTTCFRSVPSIIDWVNAVFTPWFEDGAGSLAQPPFEPLHADRSPQGPGPAVLTLGGRLTSPDDQGEISAERVRQVQSSDLALAIREAVADGWPVGDPGRPDGSRPLAYDDVAILIPTRTCLPQLEAALADRGVPYRVESTSLVFSTPEVADLVTVVRAVTDPSDALGVVAALRSPVYACSDQDLAAWYAAGGGWDPFGTPPEGLDGPVASGLGHLRSLATRARWCTPSELVERIIDERHVMALSLDLPRARDAWRRIRWLADQARVFSEAGGRDLGGWLEWLDVLADDENRTVDVVHDELDDDAVHILTIHGAKGLEYPMVVLAGLAAEERERKVSVLWADDGPEVHLTQKLRTSGYADLEGAEAAFASAERVRLLYVAATRARDHLVLPLHHLDNDRDSFARALWERGDELAPLWRELDLTGDEPSGPPPPSATGPTDPIEGPAERDEWIRRRRLTLERAACPATVSPTALAQELAGATSAERVAPDGTGPDVVGDVEAATAEDGVDPDGDDVDDRLAWSGRRGRGGTALGRAVHGVLQQVDPRAPADVDALARVQAGLEGVPGDTAKVVRLARHAMASPSVAQAVDHPHWRELYVATPVGNRLLEGFIDLLVDGPDGLTVVDYKTALGASDADIDERAADYGPQAVAYALAVERLVGRPVERATFVFLRDEGSTERDVPDLAAAVAAMAAHLEPAS